MAVQAAITRYKDEMIAGFERRRSDLSTAMTKEFMSSGLSVVWLVGTSGGAAAVTRGQNGDIPYNVGSNTQVTGTLVEKHAPFSLTGFDVFASQGNQTQKMKDDSMATIRRDQDDTILAEMANATQDFGSGPLTLATITTAKAILGQNHVPTEEVDNMFGLLSPGALNYLEQTTEFTSKDYVDVPVLGGSATRKFFRYAGVNWIVSSAVSGLGTASEVLYMWHRAAIGYACNAGEMKVDADFNREQQRSWSLATIYHCAKILQNTGIVKITHDSSAVAST